MVLRRGHGGPVDAGETGNPDAHRLRVAPGLGAPLLRLPLRRWLSFYELQVSTRFKLKELTRIY